MGKFKDTLSRIFQRKAAEKEIETPVSESVLEESVVSRVSELEIKTVIAEEKKVEIPKALSPAEKAEKLARSRGLDVRIMTGAEATSKSHKATQEHIQQYYDHRGTDDEFIRPTVDQLYLVRATDVFPEDSTLKPVSHGVRMFNHTDTYFIDRILAQEMKKLGITQKDGKPVTCQKDLNNVELSEEMLEYAKKIDLGEDYKDSLISPIRKLYLQSKHKAESMFKLPIRSERETLHFTLNTLVSSHDGGNWEGSPFVFIEPYKPHHGTFKNLGGFDSWKFGDVSLESPTLLIRPETLEQVIAMSKTNPQIQSTLKKCKIIIMNTDEKTHDTHYVSAVLHEQGAPAYVCKDKYVLAVAGDEKNAIKEIQGDGLSTSLRAISDDLTAQGTPTSANALHSNTGESVEEKNMTVCSSYSSMLAFARFLANKINHSGLSEKIKKLEELDSTEKLEKFYKEAFVDEAERKYGEACESGSPKAEDYYKVYASCSRVLSLNPEHKIREAAIKEILYDWILTQCSPILDQMSNDKVVRLMEEFSSEYISQLEQTYSKPVRFDMVKNSPKNEEAFGMNES